MVLNVVAQGINTDIEYIRTSWGVSRREAERMRLGIRTDERSFLRLALQLCLDERLIGWSDEVSKFAIPLYRTP